MIKTSNFPILQLLPPFFQNYKSWPKFSQITNLLLNFSKLRIYGSPSKIPNLISKVTEITNLLQNQLIIYKNTLKSFRSMPNNFKTYQSTLIDPRNPNITSILSKTSPIVRNRRLKFRTKIPFGQNSSKNRFASSYHVLHTLPIKTHKFHAKNHTKTSPKINNSVRSFMRKMH